MNTTEQSPVNEKAIRRWINDQYEGAAGCATWTLEDCQAYVEQFHVQGLDAFRQTPYRSWDVYRAARPAAREAIDAVFDAIRNSASPLLGLDLSTESGMIRCSFTWHDGAQYRVEVTREGLLSRLFRYELTGGWTLDDGAEGGMVPDTTWRTVRTFSKDRAGKVLAPALTGRRGTPAWTRAAGL